MKRFIVCASMFLFAFILLVGSSEAKLPLQLKIYEVHADLDYIDIYGENFGTMPAVMLDSLILTVVSSSDTTIQALNPGRAFNSQGNCKAP